MAAAYTEMGLPPYGIMGAEQLIVPGVREHPGTGHLPTGGK